MLTAQILGLTARKYGHEFYKKERFAYKNCEISEISEIRGGASKPRFYERNELNEIRQPRGGDRELLFRSG